MEPPATWNATWKKRLRAAAPRLLLAHALAYPVAFAWAIAAIPLSIVSLPDAVVMDGSVDTVVQIVLRKLAWPAFGVFVVEHLAAIPWARADVSHAPRARRVFWIATGALASVALVVGGASWLWLVLR